MPSFALGLGVAHVVTTGNSVATVGAPGAFVNNIKLEDYTGALLLEDNSSVLKLE